MYSSTKHGKVRSGISEKDPDKDDVPISSRIQTSEMMCVSDNLPFQELKAFIYRISNRHYCAHGSVDMHCESQRSA